MGSGEGHRSPGRTHRTMKTAKHRATVSEAYWSFQEHYTRQRNDQPQHRAEPKDTGEFEWPPGSGDFYAKTLWADPAYREAIQNIAVERFIGMVEAPAPKSARSHVNNYEHTGF